MGSGDRFKHGFMRLLDHLGAPVVVYKNYGTNTEKRTRIPKAMKNKNSSKDVFLFPDRIDIQPGDMIQEEGAKDLWLVVDTEDRMVAGTLTGVEVEVTKATPAGAPRPKQHGGNVVSINGPVYGGLQVGSTNSTQNVKVVVNPKLDETIAKLLDAIHNSDLDQLDREDATAAVSRVQELAGRDQTPETSARIMEKLNVVEKMIGISQKLAPIAMPLVQMIQGMLK